MCSYITAPLLENGRLPRSQHWPLRSCNRYYGLSSHPYMGLSRSKQTAFRPTCFALHRKHLQYAINIPVADVLRVVKEMG